MAADNEKELNNSKEIGKLQAEVHAINSNFNEFKDEMKGLIDKLFTRFEEHTTKRPISLPAIVSGIASLFVVIAGLIGVVIWIVNALNAPLSSAITQNQKIIQELHNRSSGNTNQIRIIEKDIEVVKSKAIANESSLQYIINDQELFPRLKSQEKDIEFILYRIQKLEKGN